MWCTTRFSVGATIASTLAYINDLNKVIVHSKVYHFADDTKFLYASHSLKNLNKSINFDLSSLVHWQKGRLSGQNIETKCCTKYLGVIIDDHLPFNEYMNTLKQKPNGTKLNYYVTADIFKIIYYALFDSQMRYLCQIWRQRQSKTFYMIQFAQSKALRIISFKQFMELSEPLYSQLNINRLKNNVILNNCFLSLIKLANNIPDVFDQFFKPFKELNNHNARESQQYLLNVLKTNTQMFGSNSIKIE